MTTPARVPYQPIEDIPNLDKAEMDALETDEQMRDMLASTRFALKHSSNLKKPSHYKQYIAEILKYQLYMFSITHASIREIVAVAHKNKEYTIVGDAMSLTREQIEKIFIIAALLDKPNRNFRQYLRSSWKVKYEKFLLETEEHKENERFKKYLKETLPKQLERARRNQYIRSNNDVLVSKFAMRVLKFKWNKPEEKKAPFLKGKNVQQFINEYFSFATPGTSVAKINDPELRRFLYRWHKEYVIYCQFSHVTMTKLAFAEMAVEKSLEKQRRMEEFGIEHSIRAVNTSYTAAASACALILSEVSKTYGASNELKEFWEKLVGFSLLSKALWNMYVGNVI